MDDAVEKEHAAPSTPAKVATPSHAKTSPAPRPARSVALSKVTTILAPVSSNLTSTADGAAPSTPPHASTSVGGSVGDPVGAGDDGAALGAEVGELVVGLGEGRVVGLDVGAREGFDVGLDVGLEDGSTETVGVAVGAWSKRPVSASAQNARRFGDAASSSIDTSRVSASDSIMNESPATAPPNVNSIV